MEGLDYTSLSAAEAHKLGAKFVGRYAGTSAKCITESEKVELQALGIAVYLYSEGTGKEWRGGRAAGITQATGAVAAATKLGMPVGSFIAFAVDEDPRPFTAAEMALANEYLDGAASVLGATYEAKFYGGFALVNQAAGTGHVQTYAWSDGKLSVKAGLYQYLNGATYDHVRTTATGPVPVKGWMSYDVNAAPVPVVPISKVPAPVSKDKLRAGGNYNARAGAAVKTARVRVSSHYSFGPGECAKAVRTAYALPVSAWGKVPTTAAGAWHAAHKTHSWYNPPVGVPVFWLGGSTGAGHVAIADGLGNVLTTDFGPNGYIGDGETRVVPIADIAKHDPALEYVGWAEDYLGAVVYE